MMRNNYLPDSLALAGFVRQVLMVEELDIPLLMIDFVHLEYQVDQLLVHHGQHDAAVLQAKPLEPFLRPLYVISGVAALSKGRVKDGRALRS